MNERTNETTEQTTREQESSFVRSVGSARVSGKGSAAADVSLLFLALLLLPCVVRV